METTQPNPTHKRRTSGRRTNSKAGCHTCKIRRVKCDEGWPGCQRCLSTRRTCDGYGVWGGGTGLKASTPSNLQTQAVRE
ncbi:hypothetical protein F5883DRAFT_574867 [Diaporthe sp. PMI_573]|nr:hypothetical protein F5883DRAFT_574867 [Diaporthaceae sp. PMI_573]